MNNENQKPIKIILNIVLMCLFIGALFAYTNYYKGNVLNKQNEELVDNLVPEPVKNCGLSIISPVKNGNVSANFELNAVVDNSERELLGCSWTVFEAQAGVVYVKDGAGNDIAKPTPLGTKEEWMTDAPVNYFADISILNGYTGKAFVIINEENPSDEKVSKTILVPIVIN